jgi:hypothetical protein
MIFYYLFVIRAITTILTTHDMRDEDIRNALLEIEETIRGKEFERWRKKFVEKYVNEFTFEDENKLIYTEIHQEYEQHIEKQISEYLSDGFDMNDFMASLPEYISGPGKSDEATGKAITMLLEVSDFEQFKVMMMVNRREREEEESKMSERQLVGISTTGSDIAAFDVDGMMDMCAALSNAADEEAGWVNLLTLDWMKIDKKAVDESRRRTPNDIYLRGVWTMNLNIIECCDMMFSVSSRRQKWDPNFGGTEFPHGGSELDDDTITSTSLNFGYLVNLVMFGSGSGTVLNCRNIRKWNYPTQGSVTYSMVPWDIKLNKMDEKHKLLSLKTGTISPHPTMADKCVMTTLEINTMGNLPGWAMHFMMKATAPSMMRSLETRYTVNIKNTNETVNITPFGRDDDNGEGKHNESKSYHK